MENINWIDLLRYAEPAFEVGRLVIKGVQGITVARATRRECVLIVQISQLALPDVLRFMELQRIQPELFVVSRRGQENDAHLPYEPVLWQELVRDFVRGFNEFKRQHGAQPVHVFLSAPIALAFAMGCATGMQNDVHVYQWAPQGVPDAPTYVEVFPSISRARLIGG